MLGLDVLEEHDGMLMLLMLLLMMPLFPCPAPGGGGRGRQDGSEVGGADTEHEFVGLEHLTPAREGHVGQHFVRAQLGHDAEEGIVVVVPFQKEFFPAHIDDQLVAHNFVFRLISFNTNNLLAPRDQVEPEKNEVVVCLSVRVSLLSFFLSFFLSLTQQVTSK